MTKYLYGLLLFCNLLILFDGLSTDKIVSTHSIHSVFLVVYRDMSYPFLSDFSKIKVLCLDFHYYWLSLLSISVSFQVLLYSFGDKGTTNFIKDTEGFK